MTQPTRSSTLGNIVWAQQQVCGSPLEKLMLISIAEDCGPEAQVDVNFARLAEFCCCSKEACSDALKELERRGHLLMMTFGPNGSDVALPWWRTAADIEVSLFNPRKSFPLDLRKTMMECQMGLCWYCAADLATCGATPHLDHQIPVSRGGPDHVENLVLTCPTCNITKKDKTVPEFRQYVIERDRLSKTYRFHGEAR